MNILVKRIYTCSTYTISHVYIDGKYVCDALEDTDRLLDQSMSNDTILKYKVKGKTAIPTGKYRVLMNVVSPKFSKKTYYQRVCNGRVPRIDNVPGFSGVLIHVGNTHTDTEGCLLVGYNTIKGAITDSRKAFETIYPILYAAYTIGSTIWIEFTRTY